jgi:hypothetical protein
MDPRNAAEPAWATYSRISIGNALVLAKRLVFVESPERRFSGCSRAPRHPCRMRSVPRRSRAPQVFLGFVAGAEQSAPPIFIAKISPKYAQKNRRLKLWAVGGGATRSTIDPGVSVTSSRRTKEPRTEVGHGGCAEKFYLQFWCPPPFMDLSSLTHPDHREREI